MLFNKRSKSFVEMKDLLDVLYADPRWASFTVQEKTAALDLYSDIETIEPLVEDLESTGQFQQKPLLCARGS